MTNKPELREPFTEFPVGSFPNALRELIKRNCLEVGSNTADFILAEYLINCLDNFDMCVRKRDEMYEEEEKESLKYDGH